MKTLTRLAAILAVIAVTSCGEKKKSGEDTQVDTPVDVQDTAGDTEEDTPVDTVEDTPADTAPDTAVDTEEDTPADTVEEEGTLPGDCGNSILNTGEVCDDGNVDNEPCDTTDPDACLADCSLLMAECGDGASDPGEQCDDGDTDSMDGCTTSCTTNDHMTGAPCTCTGSGCSALDFTGGTIDGCSALASLEDSTRSLACMRSAVDTTYGITVYGAGGYCVLMAMGCTGSTVLCAFVPTTGNVSTITCPSGTAMTTDVRTEMGGAITVTTKVCHQTCTSQSGCRWNEVEPTGSPFAGDCGQWACVPGGDAGELICADPRNAAP